MKTLINKFKSLIIKKKINSNNYNLTYKTHSNNNKIMINQSNSNKSNYKILMN